MEGLSFKKSPNRPDLVALQKLLEAHEDNINLLYLTDSEASLQTAGGESENKKKGEKIKKEGGGVTLTGSGTRREEVGRHYFFDPQ